MVLWTLGAGHTAESFAGRSEQLDFRDWRTPTRYSEVVIATFELNATAWVLLVVAALLIGIAKTALPGLATIAVAIFAAILPAKESTAVMLWLLIVGDLTAIWTYRHNVDWRSLRRLAPAVLVGIAIGAFVLSNVNDATMKRMIGIILLTLTAFTIALMWWRARTSSTDAAALATSTQSFANSALARWTYGGLGGFTTMVANSGGPPMTLYFMASGFDMIRFLGTQAWFFFLINLTKVPFQAGLGLYSPQSAGTDALLIPPVLIGALVGRKLIKGMNERIFTPLVIGLTVISSMYLLF